VATAPRSSANGLPLRHPGLASLTSVLAGRHDLGPLGIRLAVWRHDLHARGIELVLDVRVQVEHDLHAPLGRASPGMNSCGEYDGRTTHVIRDRQR
jgi:hypothetical protein